MIWQALALFSVIEVSFKKVGFVKKRLAIISSYNELCGNATYTEVLRKEFSNHYEVDVLALNVGLLNSNRKQIRRLAEAHIEDLAEKIKEYDYVNIQFEAGLFGIYRGNILKRLLKLVVASKNLVVTMHRVDFPESFLGRGAIKALLKFKFRFFVRQFVASLKNNYQAKLYHCILKALKRYKAAILVHTKRDSVLIKTLYQYNRVYDHPISFLNIEDYESYLAKADKSKFKKQYFLKEDEVAIGIFGFISEYKGHHTILEAMKFLPNHYKLLIFGGQHPSSIQANERLTPYIGELVKEISSCLPEFQQLKDRVTFCSGLGDDEFINALLCCDATVLPYLETNQGGSGVASLTLETRAKSVFSMNYSFMQLQHYAKDAFPMATIGNPIEFAQKIRYLVESPEHPYAEKLRQYHEIFNLKTNVEFYCSLFENAEKNKN